MEGKNSFTHKNGSIIHLNDTLMNFGCKAWRLPCLLPLLFTDGLNQLIHSALCIGRVCEIRGLIALLFSEGCWISIQLLSQRWVKFWVYRKILLFPEIAVMFEDEKFFGFSLASVSIIMSIMWNITLSRFMVKLFTSFQFCSLKFCATHLHAIQLRFK